MRTIAQAFGLLLAAAHPAWAASLAAIVPPPGLYQVDSTSSHAQASLPVVVEQDLDGATGDRVSRTRVPGGTSSMRSAGSGPETRCVQSRSPGAMAQATLMHALSDCPNQHQKIVGQDTVVHTAQCPGSRSTITFRKRDSRTWEIESRVETYPVQGPLDLSHLRTMLEHEARHGATADRRKEAAARLKELPAALKQIEAQRSATAADLNAALARAQSDQEREMIRKALASLHTRYGPASTIATTRERWTSLGRQCDGQQGAR